MSPKNCYFRGTFKSTPKVAIFRGISIKSAPKCCYLLGHYIKISQNPSNWRKFDQSALIYDELGTLWLKCLKLELLGALWRVKIWCTWAPVILFLKYSKIIFLSVKKSKNKNVDVANYLSHKREKKSSSNTLYFGLHKKDKSLNLSTYILKSTNFLRFVIFV
jgi:hypothetical protein